MRLLSKMLPLNCEIALHGDVHEGNQCSANSGVRALKQWLLANPKRRFFANMGDEIDAICTNDKRFHMPSKKLPALPLQQAQAVVEDYAPVAAQCLFWLYGNHPLTLDQFGNITQDLICKPLGVPYGTWTCKFCCNFPNGKSFKIFAAHGAGGRLTSAAKDYGQRQANMEASLKMRLKEQAGDCLVNAVGHSHKLLVVLPVKKLILTDNGVKLQQHYMTAGAGDANGYIEPDRRWYVNTGSYLKKYSDSGDPTYSERAGYDPVELGHVKLIIRNGELMNIEKVIFGG
jgi:hypothetical protein